MDPWHFIKRLTKTHQKYLSVWRQTKEEKTLHFLTFNTSETPSDTKCPSLSCVQLFHKMRELRKWMLLKTNRSHYVSNHTLAHTTFLIPREGWRCQGAINNQSKKQTSYLLKLSLLSLSVFISFCFINKHDSYSNNLCPFNWQAIPCLLTLSTLTPLEGNVVLYISVNIYIFKWFTAHTW